MPQLYLEIPLLTITAFNSLSPSCHSESFVDVILRKRSDRRIWLRVNSAKNLNLKRVILSLSKNLNPSLFSSGFSPLVLPPPLVLPHLAHSEPVEECYLINPSKNPGVEENDSENTWAI